jgi:hypothetical protein
VLFAGPSGSGKSTAATGFFENLAEQHYQFCLIDPEGDYENFIGALQFGSPQSAPDVKQVMKALEDPGHNLVVSLLGVPLEDRPLFFASLFPLILNLRARTGRPHWMVLDEAHHMLPSSWSPALATLPQAITGLIFITVHPGKIAPCALEHVEVAVAVGNQPQNTLSELAKALSQPEPNTPDDALKPREGMVWCRGAGLDPFVIKLCEAKTERRRHLRKYAQGDLGPDRSFYFRGPENKLKLQAQNLQIFNTIAEGVDDGTWLFHLQNHDYSIWFREKIKDNGLAEEVAAIETTASADAQASRAAIKGAVERRYTGPA